MDHNAVSQANGGLPPARPGSIRSELDWICACNDLFAIERAELLGAGGGYLSDAERALAERSFADGESPEHFVKMILQRRDRTVGSQSLVSFIERYRNAARCAACQKTTAVVNVAARGFRAEKITAETHCTCPGGPAHHLLEAVAS